MRDCTELENRICNRVDAMRLLRDLLERLCAEKEERKK